MAASLPDDLRAHLDEHLAHHGVDLAGHDGGTGLGGGQLQFADAATRAGTEQADVVGDFDQADGDGLECAAGFDDGIARGLRFEMVGGFAQFEAGFVGDAVNGFAREINVGVDAGADGGAAKGQFAKVGFDFPEAVDAVLDLAGVTAEFLAEPDGRGVLQMRAADFQDVAESLRLGEQRGVQFIQRRNELVNDGVQGGEMNGGGDDVVAGLAAVDMVIGMDRFIAAFAAERIRWRDWR